MAAVNERVHPNCVNASNPYHECGMACLEKIAQGQGQKEKKKLDNHNGVKGGVISKMKNEERKVNPNCPKASNPYHACGEYCFKGNGEANVRKESGSWSFGRKKSDSQPNSPPLLGKVSAGDKHPEARYGQSEYHTKKKVESKNDRAYSSSEQRSRDIHPEDHSFNQKEVQSPRLVPPPVNVKTDSPKYPPKESVTSPIAASPKHAKDEELQTAHDVHHNAENGEKIARSAVLSMNFSFTGTDTAPGDSDEEESESIISDSVSVGKYHVRASVSSILESILNRYGDIAANCKLESKSMRTYYLECLCSVVHELQSTSLAQMNKAKVKEMLAVLKDVESVQIDVDWLRNILIEISEAIELSAQHQTVEAAKANCDNLLESTREELETQMKELSVKEKEVADLKAHIAETKNCLSELEFESTHLEETIKSTRSKVEKFSRKSLAEDLL